ncbi:MAG: mannitol dehydrogenase family protein [Lautropia sp.]
MTRGAAPSLPRLTPRSLASVATAHRVPAYRLQDLRIGVVHLGVGNFHRAHQAPCYDAIAHAGDLRWGVSGVSLQRPALRDALAPQSGLYALDTGDARLQVIGCLRETLAATDPGAADAIAARMADPQVHWWTLTVTEKGYCLDAGHPGLRADLEDGSRPATAPGQLFAGLVRRFGERAATDTRDALPLASAVRAAASALTIASCDNLSGNGRTLRRALRGFAEAARREPHWRARAGRLAGEAGPIDAIDLLPELIEERVAFPDSMVDRIVPATTDALRERVASRLGLVDAWPVATEAFTQWVIEDRIRGARPALERCGVQWVDDVGPYEALKLRLLNAAHSVLAYAGLLAGHETVDQAFSDPAIGGFVERYWRETAIPALPSTARAQAEAYCTSLRARFANPGIRHALAQIAHDGSLKIPLRWLGPDRSIEVPGTALEPALACWIRWLATAPAAQVVDPLAPRLRDAARHPDPATAAAGVLAILGATGPAARLEALARCLRGPAHPLDA